MAWRRGDLQTEAVLAQAGHREKPRVKIAMAGLGTVALTATWPGKLALVTGSLQADSTGPALTLTPVSCVPGEGEERAPEEEEDASRSQ